MDIQETIELHTHCTVVMCGQHSFQHSCMLLSHGRHWWLLLNREIVWEDKASHST